MKHLPIILNKKEINDNLDEIFQKMLVKRLTRGLPPNVTLFIENKENG